MVGAEGLGRWVDRSQLPAALDGTQAYDHDEWLELRIVLEEIIWRALDELRDLHQVRGGVGIGSGPGEE